MNPWHKLPFLRLLLPFLAGIMLSASGLPEIQGILTAIVILLVLQLLSVVYHRTFFGYAYRWIPGLMIFLFFLLAGMWRERSGSLPKQSSYFGNFRRENSRQLWMLKVTGPVSIKNKSIRTTGEILYLIDNKLFNKTCGKIILSFEKDSVAAALAQGDLIVFQSYLREIPGPAFPAGFDYASFSAHKGILFQVYLKHTDWRLLQKNHSISLRHLAWQWQQKLVGIIKEQSLERDEEAVGCAMLLGYTDGFGQDLQGAYSRAGVTHILSVSGLHVGLIFLICSRLLFFLNRNRSQKVLKTLLLVVLTWLYCLLTGLAPCVQRAGVMFSFLIVGQSMGRKSNIVNTLFASAFLLLYLQPSNIYDFGFQLSYLAVLGILWLEPLIYPMVYVPNKYLDKLWKMVAVTLAAQLATCPMAGFHFHQFPTWFIPANLVVIPLSTLVMYLGICLLATSFLPFVSVFFGFCFGWSIRLMNYLVELTDRLPFAVIEGLYPTIPGVILCFLLIASTAAWLSTASKKWAMSALVIALLYSVSLIFNDINRQSSKEMVFFQHKKTDWYGLRKGNHLLLYSRFTALSDSQEVKIKLRPWLLKTRNHSIVWNSDSILYYDPVSVNISEHQVLWATVGYGADKALSFRPERIILGVGIPYKSRSKWQNYAQKNGIPFHDCRKQGCILLKL